MVIQSQFLMGQSITDYNYKKPLHNDYQILDKSKIFGSIVDLSSCTNEERQILYL